MTTDFDPRTRIVLSWLREDAHENPEHMLLRALDEVDATPQRRSWWPAWRSNRMNTSIKLIAAAAAVLVVAVAGYQLLPSNGGVGGMPTTTPSPSPSLLAQGSFTSHGVAAQIDATGSGANVAGAMSLSESDTGHRATVDLECTNTTDSGLIVIAGLVTESTFDDGFPQGYRVAVLFQRGSPVEGVWWISGTNETPMPSCQALVDSIDDAEAATALEPIEGTVELAP